MKVKKHLQIDAIMNSTGRLPNDMENLEVYHHSSSTGEPINVGEMDLTYLIRAFAKCQRQLSQEVRIDTQEGKIKDMVSKEAYQTMWDNCQQLTKQVEEKEQTITSLRERLAHWHKLYNEITQVKGDRYAFSEIPNDASGRAFVAQLREYLNTESYSVRVRGQYLNDETKKTEGWRPYSFGQPISKSKCLRVYVDKNK